MSESATPTPSERIIPQDLAPVKDTRWKRRMAWFGNFSFSFITGLATFLILSDKAGGAGNWLPWFFAAASTALTVGFLFCYQLVKRSKPCAKASLPHKGTLTLMFSQAAIGIGMVLMVFILMLKPIGSRRAVGIPVEWLNPQGLLAAGISGMITVGLLVLALGLLNWRDWKKTSLTDQQLGWFWFSFSLLVVAAVEFAISLSVLCLPQVFVKIIAES